MKRFAAHGPMIEDEKHGTYVRLEYAERLQKTLARQIGDTRVCPDCGHAFVPVDKTSDDAIEALSE